MADLAPHELRILVAVEREQSFTAAAESLGMSQSAVSHAVRTCERKIGAVLFDRGRHGARATEAGARAAVQARRILRLLDTLAAEARGTATGTVSGPLRIAAFRSAAAQLLPAVLARLTARHPELAPQVRIVREIGPGTAGEVAEGRADLGIATLDAATGRLAGLVATPLFEEPYALAHPEGSTDPKSLPMIDWVENCGSYTRDWWKRQAWIPPSTLDVEDDGFALSLVAKGIGTAIMPWTALLGRPPGIALTDLGPNPPTRTVGFVTTPDLADSLAVRALIRELRSAPLPDGLRPLGPSRGRTARGASA